MGIDESDELSNKIAKLKLLNIKGVGCRDLADCVYGLRFGQIMNDYFGFGIIFRASCMHILEIYIVYLRF